jgi:hypothetical protein
MLVKIVVRVAEGRVFAKQLDLPAVPVRGDAYQLMAVEWDLVVEEVRWREAGEGVVAEVRLGLAVGAFEEGDERWLAAAGYVPEILWSPGSDEQARGRLLRSTTYGKNGMPELPAFRGDGRG